MRGQWARVAARADLMEEGDVTSRVRVRRLGVCGREVRVEGFRAVATTREVVWVKRWVARAWPMPEEQPVMNQTASSERL